MGKKRCKVFETLRCLLFLSDTVRYYVLSVGKMYA